MNKLVCFFALLFSIPCLAQIVVKEDPNPAGLPSKIRTVPGTRQLWLDTQGTPWIVNSDAAFALPSPTLVNGKMDYVVVADYAAAQAAATGSRPKKIRVLNDTDGYPSIYEYWPDSTATDKLEAIITN